VNTELSRRDRSAPFHMLGLASGMILPAGLLFGIDDPAEWYAPGMILLALGERRSQVFSGGKNFDAEENRFGGVRTLQLRGGDHIWD